MHTVRPPAVAGTFYPADRSQLSSLLQDLLKQAKAQGEAPKAIIAPHAGYIYSGPIAASAYATLLSRRDVITRVILLGPAHRVGFVGLAVSSADAFSTPLGQVPLDQDAIAHLLDLPYIKTLDQAHAFEHSLEVHLPFLQTVLHSFTLVPIVVGNATPREIANALDCVWGGDDTLIVVSSDLSHYHDYATAKQMDAHTSSAIEALQPEQINHDDACGRLPISGLLLAARQRGMKASTVDLRNSGDTAGSKDSVVGYGAYVIR